MSLTGCLCTHNYVEASLSGIEDSSWEVVKLLVLIIC